MSGAVSVDPRTGAVVEKVADDATSQEVDDMVNAAHDAAPALDELGRHGRARLLSALADALEHQRAEVVQLADRETALGQQRLEAELTRTTYQLRLFAAVVVDGGYLEATLDHAADTPMGPRPDLRRMLVPIGAVGVFGASNFPLAFSVPGGDTAAALAAGCPVVVKGHPSHPATSQLCATLMRDAAIAAGAPEATITLIHGIEAGTRLVAHPRTRAVAFTGSLAGGRALMQVIEQRPDPIPFFGELSSINPVVVTPAAAADRGTELGLGLVGSYTLGQGQFCTKPGLVMVPATPAGDQLIAGMAARVRQLEGGPLLNAGIAAAYERGTSERVVSRNVDVLAAGGGGQGAGALLLGVAPGDVEEHLLEELFGPVTLVVRWSDEAELASLLSRLGGQLTLTILCGDGETALPGRLQTMFRDQVGRIVFNGFPTGVAVSWAQHHGGPWPATNTQHTSVGPASIRRFLRPLAWQDAPLDVLPHELRDGYDSIPRRIDGEFRAARPGDGGRRKSAVGT